MVFMRERSPKGREPADQIHTLAVHTVRHSSVKNIQSSGAKRVYEGIFFVTLASRLAHKRIYWRKTISVWYRGGAE